MPKTQPTDEPAEPVQPSTPGPAPAQPAEPVATETEQAIEWERDEPAAP